MTWQPDQSSLNQLLTILRDAINPNNKEQALIQQVWIKKKKKKKKEEKVADNW